MGLLALLQEFYVVLLESVPPAIPPLLFVVLLPSFIDYISDRNNNSRKKHKCTISLRHLFLPMVIIMTISALDLMRCRHKYKIHVTTLESIGHGSEFALVTGASSGIGREIASEMGRRGMNLVLVARDKRTETKIDDLEELAIDLEKAYGIAVKTFRADFSISGESRRLYAETTAANLTISHLVLAAGWGPTMSHIALGEEEISMERTIAINMESTAILSSLYAKDMAKLVQEKCSVTPNILIVSSVVGVGAGQPGAALYAATKAFGLSLAQGLSVELEPLGIGVTALTPGATATNFAYRGGQLQDAALWNFPFTVSKAADVAKDAVDTMMRGGGLVMPGIANYITFQILEPLVSRRLAMKFYEFCWRPWPFKYYPLGWRKTGLDSDVPEGEINSKSKEL